MIKSASAALVAFTILAGSVSAHAQQSNETGRYTMHKVDEGYIRLDTRTGAVSVCRKKDDDWSCEIAADDARKMQDEIAELKKRNSQLEAQLEAGVQRPDEPYDFRKRYNDRPGSDSFRWPTEKEVDKTLDYFENLLKKFQDRLKRLEKDTPEPQEKQL